MAEQPTSALDRQDSANLGGTPRERELQARVDELQRRLQASEERTAWLQEIGQAIAGRDRQEDAISVILDRIVRIMGAERGAIYLADANGKHIVARTIHGGQLREIRLELGQGLAGHCAQALRPINVKDARRDRRWHEGIDELTGQVTRSVLNVPMQGRTGKLVGVIQVINKVGDSYFSVDDEQMLGSIASTTAIFIENFNLYLKEISRNIELSEIRMMLEERVRELDALYELQREINAANDAEDELRSVLRTALHLLPSAAAIITTVDDGEQQSCVMRGGDETTLSPIDRGQATQDLIISGCRPVRQRTVLIEDTAVYAHLGLEPHSYLGVPIRVNNRCVGAIELLNRTPAQGAQSRFQEEDAKILLLIAGQIGRSLLTSRLRRRREREERIAAIGSMLSGILHDLKSPLTIASGYVQLMERSDDAERRREYGSLVRKQFDDIRQMTHEVVAYARGELKVYERTVHLSIFADELRQLLRHEFEGTGIETDVVLETRGDVRIDEGKLKRILFNLARNAREAMAEGGSYTIRIYREEGELVFSCTDTGGGIPRGIQRRLFDAFVSAGKEQRSGLGLAIVKRLVGEMQGRVSFDSTLGKGTTFFISVPWQNVGDTEGLAGPAGAAAE